MPSAGRANTSNPFLLEAGTASDSLVPSDPVVPTAAATGSTLDMSGRIRIRAADIRDRAALLASDADGVHQRAQDYDLQQRAHIKARSAVPALVAELATERGMSWSSIARLVGVTVGAVRKWRSEGAATAENRRALARLAAFLDLLEGFSVEDPAGWLEMPLVDGYTVTATDLYRKGMQSSLLDFASMRVSVYDLMDEFDEHWRRTHRASFDVFKAEDGELALRRRHEDG